MTRYALTQARVKELLDYDPATGLFRWKASRRPGHNGKLAGKIGGGTYRYAVIGLDGRNYGTAKVAWLYVHGEWPSRQLRFLNGDPSDASIGNLELRAEPKARYKQGRPVSQDVAEYKANVIDRIRWNRKGHLKAKFGISPETYVAMLEAQSGVCAICRKPEIRIVNGAPSCLAVDHNHETGQIRGLLCFKCNCAIGKLGDDPENVDRAAEYLRLYALKTRATPVVAHEEQS